MTTKIVNLYKEKFDVYIGRKGKGQDGYFGNPIKIDSNNVCEACGKIHDSGGSTLECFEQYFLWRIENDSEFKGRVISLKNKTLGCFCKPKACHGDVIVKWVEENVR